MASWGLLQGFGRGLSQSSELLARGMAEDREVERQRLREASAEARWKRQEQREDARNKVTDERLDRQEDRQKRLDNLTAEESAAQKKYREDTLALQRDELNARTDLARKERIENKLNSYIKESERKGEAIDRKYDRLIDIAKSNGATGGDLETLYKARDAEHEGLEQQTKAKLIPALKSFGTELQGTAFSSYYDELINPEPPPSTQSGSADPAMVQGVLSDLTGGSNNARAAAVNGVLNQPDSQPAPAATRPAQQQGLTLDKNGSPELSFSNLMKKWSTPSADSPARPALLSQEAIQQQQQFMERLKQNNIQSAYGASSLQNGRK